MKTLLLASLLTAFAAQGAQAQNASTPPPSTGADAKAVWEKPAAICNPYQAEKDAEGNMKPAVKALYDASQTPEDRNVNAARNIICNPPTRQAPKKDN